MKSLTIIFVLGLLSVVGFSQKPKPKPTPAKPAATKPKPSATPQKKPDEKTEWEKSSTVEDAAGRVTALQKFNTTFPKSARKIEALALISLTRGQMGNDKLAEKDIDSAVTLFKLAATEAPKPVSDQIFTEILSKIPPNLYFRGARDEAIEIAKVIEGRVDTNAGQLLNIAAFYMSIENGTEAKRIADKAIVLEPNSSTAYQTLGLANRIDFNLDESAAAFAKALELEPDSLTARRGLAEMKRSLGKSDEAAALYREILAKEADNIPAQTGLVLSLFDAGKKADAEAEMAKSLETAPGNVILLASAAYWYAVNSDGVKAVELAQKAIVVDPRFIWSHIALARGLMVQKDPGAAEKALIAARQYGNFPTLEYEIASARVAAGYYREAGEELAKSFRVKDGVVQTKLGGRVARESKYFAELVGFERRASIFAPTAADDPENAAKLTALLELKQNLDAAEPNADATAKAIDSFVAGDDKMKIHRQIYAASQLLDKKVALAKVVDLAKAATGNVDAGLDVPNASIAVLASELYESRAIAAAKGEYIVVPNVERLTLAAIIRGRIEDLNGWVLYEMNNPAESVVRLKRAVGVLPVDSAWWRASMWRLGSALILAGKDAEALEAYIKCYKSSGPNAFRYNGIAGLYKKVNGNTEGLDLKIGPDPTPPVAAETVAQKTEPTPTPVTTPEVKVETPSATLTSEVKTEPTASPTPEVKVETPTPTPSPEVKTEPTATPQPTPPPDAPKPSDDKPKKLFPPVVITIPSSDAKPVDTAEAKPCIITASEESLTLENGGGDLALIIGVEGDSDLTGLTATTSSPADVSIRRELIGGVKSRAIFVVRSVSSKAGLYQVKFEMPCGAKVVVVKVR